MANESDGGQRKYVGLYMGVVINNKDPEKLGRVRARIPGITETSPWAFPLGWPGAGARKRGSFSPPPEGAEVGVFFHQGDIDHPHYLCGHPGRGEAPDEVDESTPEDAVKVHVHETERWRFTFDERPEKALLQLRDKKTGDVVEIDGAALGVRIKATSALVLECVGAVDIRGANVTINGRQVAKNTKPI